MLGVQRHALTALKVDVNDALMVAQNDGIGDATRRL